MPPPTPPAGRAPAGTVTRTSDPAEPSYGRTSPDEVASPARPLPARPVLAPAVRRLWRDAANLQLGRAGRRSAVLSGLDPATRHVLTLLDGTRERAQLVLQAAAAGCPPARTSLLIELLAGAGMLADGAQGTGPLGRLQRIERERLTADLDSLALVRDDGGLPAMEHRQAARIAVHGAGRVGAPLALLLASAGIGAVDVVDERITRAHDVVVGGLAADDVGRPRGDATRARLCAAAPSADTSAQERPDLIVLAPARAEQLDEAREQLPSGVPHLLVEVRDVVGVVGPLVLDELGPCLHCLDLTRTDLDAGWPGLAAQLSVASRARQACDGPLALHVAAQAAQQVLCLVDGTTRPAALGGTLELTLPDWRWRRRSWPVHPACHCTAAQALSA